MPGCLPLSQGSKSAICPFRKNLRGARNAVPGIVESQNSGNASGLAHPKIRARSAAGRQTRECRSTKCDRGIDLARPSKVPNRSSHRAATVISTSPDRERTLSAIGNGTTCSSAGFIKPRVRDDDPRTESHMHCAWKPIANPQTVPRSNEPPSAPARS